MRWNKASLINQANQWYQTQRKAKSYCGEKSDWWLFSYDFNECIDDWCDAFIQGTYQWSPLRRFRDGNEQLDCWSYRDRLMNHVLLKTLKPTFRHVFSKQLFHLQGPSGVEPAVNQLKYNLEHETYEYVIRCDIKSYYASMDHELLINALNRMYHDERVMDYLKQVITIPVEEDAVIKLRKKGIPIRSSLSPFLGAVYLNELDRAFEQRAGICYVRFMDDVVILFKTKGQYIRGRKRLLRIIKKLKLRLSPRKTRMGKLDKGFHF